jgi:hypothetical protein
MWVRWKKWEGERVRKREKGRHKKERATQREDWTKRQRLYGYTNISDDDTM